MATLVTSLKSLLDMPLRFLIGTRAFTSGVLATGSTASRVTTGAAINYCIGGQMYLKAATANAFVHTDLTVVADGETRYFLLSLNAAGTALITQGTSTSLPECPADNCPVGAMKIVCSGGSFTPATTSHAGTGVTTTYYNLSTMPVAGVPA